MNSVFLDVDTGEDDALAILVALASGLPLKYVVASYGNSSIANTTRNTANVLALAGAREVPVLQGSTYCLNPHPVEGRDLSAGQFVGENGLCNVQLERRVRIAVERPRGRDFPEELAQRLERFAPVDYIITGPCTNLARVCLARGDSIKGLINRIVVMGGAVHYPGNSGPLDPIKGKPVAEFNFYCDPHAAEVVLQCGLPVSLVSWDVTHQVRVEPSELRTLHATGAVSDFALKLMQGFFDCYGTAHNRPFELNDPLAVLAYLGHGHFQSKRISIMQDAARYGQSVLSETGAEVGYYTLASEERLQVKKRILELLGIRQ